MTCRRNVVHDVVSRTRRLIRRIGRNGSLADNGIILVNYADFNAHAAQIDTKIVHKNTPQQIYF